MKNQHYNLNFHEKTVTMSLKMHTLHTVKCLGVDNAECSQIIKGCFITRFPLFLHDSSVSSLGKFSRARTEMLISPKGRLRLRHCWETVNVTSLRGPPLLNDVERQQNVENCETPCV